MSIDAAKLRKPRIHPGEILEEEFLTPMGISKYRLARISTSHRSASLKSFRADGPSPW